MLLLAPPRSALHPACLLLARDGEAGSLASTCLSAAPPRAPLPACVVCCSTICTPAGCLLRDS